MTNGQYLLNQLIEKKKLINQLRDELTELEADLSGMEINYNGNYAVIEFVDILDGQATLYVEENDEDGYNEIISIYELKEIL